MKLNNLKKTAALLLTAVLFCSSFALTGCKSEGDVQPSSTAAEKTSAVSSETTATEQSSTAEASTEVNDPVDGDTSTPMMEVDEQSEPVSGVSVAVIGNSMVESLYIYKTMPEADLFYRVGLTVTDVYKKECLKRNTTAIAALGNKSYDTVILIFGMNEVGWNKSSFISAYSKLVDTVREKQPNARIYIHSITPLTQKVSDQDLYGANNKAIFEFNDALKELSEEKDEKVLYLDANPMFSAKSGVMVDGATADGTHPEYKYTKKWTTLLRKYIKGDL